MTKRLATCFMTLGLLLSSASAVPAATEPPVVVVEEAPGALGKERGKDLLVAAAEDDKELLVYDPASAQVQRFLESGDSWGDPVALAAGPNPLPTFLRMDARAGSMLFSGNQGLLVVTSKGSLEHQQRIFQPGDSALIGSDRWAVALVNVPHPAKPGHFFGRRSFGDEVPRLAIFEGDEPIERALLEGDDETLSASAAGARALRLAWSGRRLFAAEVGSYKVLVFDDRLKVRAEYRDPERVYAETPGGAAETAPDLPEPAATGTDLSAPKKPKPGKAMSVQFDAVISDIAWGSQPGRLYLLLDPAGFGGRPQIDVLDPTSGMVKRSSLRLPEEWADPPLRQITVTRRWVWLRGYRPGVPTLRVERDVLDLGVEMTLPDVTLEEVPVEDGRPEN